MTNASRKSPPPVRINARLDARHADKVQELALATGSSVSDVIRDAIDYYHQARAGGAGKGRVALQRLVGCATGPRDLSSDYKRYLSRGLDAKHGHR